MRRFAERASSVVVLAVCLMGCDAAVEDAEPVAPNIPTGPDLIDDGEIPLEGLGYVEFDEERSENSVDGVVLYREGAVAPGYFLMSAIPFATATLIDDRGVEVRRWSNEVGGVWQRARILRNGDLIVVSQPADLGHFVLERRSPENELLWMKSIAVHHDVHELEDGSLLLLTWELVPLPELGVAKAEGSDEEPLMKDNQLTRLSSSGEFLESLSLGKILAREKERLALIIPERIDSETGKGKDVFHCNSIFLMKDQGLAAQNPLYSLDNLLLSSRHQSMLFVVNRRTGELVWEWKDPNVYWQHEASVLPSGNILFFDNGSSNRGYSRILELNPLTGTLEWEYTAPSPKDFFSQARGTVERLPNGNRLVGYSEKGQLFQVNDDGDVVWRYLSPFYNEKGQRGVVRVQFYDREFIASLYP